MEILFWQWHSFIYTIFDPGIISPGSLTKPKIDMAVTDLPQPDSPTIASVSFSYIVKWFPSTAFESPFFRSAPRRGQGADTRQGRSPVRTGTVHPR